MSNTSNLIENRQFLYTLKYLFSLIKEISSVPFYDDSIDAMEYKFGFKIWLCCILIFTLLPAKPLKIEKASSIDDILFSIDKKDMVDPNNSYLTDLLKTIINTKNKYFFIFNYFLRNKIFHEIHNVDTNHYFAINNKLTDVGFTIRTKRMSDCNSFVNLNKIIKSSFFSRYLGFTEINDSIDVIWEAKCIVDINMISSIAISIKKWVLQILYNDLKIEEKDNSDLKYCEVYRYWISEVSMY